MYVLVRYKLISDNGIESTSEFDELIDYSETINKFKHLLSDTYKDILSIGGVVKLEAIKNKTIYLMYLPRMSENNDMEFIYQVLREKQLKSIFTLNI